MSISNLLVPDVHKDWCKLYVESLSTERNNETVALVTYASQVDITLAPTGNLKLGTGGAGNFFPIVRAGPAANITYNNDGIFTVHLDGIYRVTAHCILVPNTPPEGMGELKFRIVGDNLTTTYAAAYAKNVAIATSEGGQSFEVTCLCVLPAGTGVCMYMTSTIGNTCTIQGGFTGNDTGVKTYIIIEKVAG